MTFIQLRLGTGPRVKSRFSPSTTMVRPGADARLELCDTDSLIKESKDSTASWSSQINAASCTLNSHLELVNFKNLCVPISESKIEN